MLLYVGIAGYLLLFAFVSGLFRFEYQMPRFLCLGIATATVSLGLIASATVAFSGVASIEQMSGASAVALGVAMLGLAIVGDGTTST